MVWSDRFAAMVSQQTQPHLKYYQCVLSWCRGKC